MTEWLPVAVLAAVQIVLRMINIAGMIWREHVHARSNCLQMRTASSSRIVLCELRSDGAMLLVVPQLGAGRGGGTAARPGPVEMAGL